MISDCKLALTKYTGSFIGDTGEQVNYQYIEIEFAPNCFAKFKLNQANLRVLQKYVPNMHQLLVNIPDGQPVIFSHGGADVKQGVSAIYSNSENEL